MRKKRWSGVLVILVCCSVISMESYAQNDHEISKLVRLRNGKAEKREEREEQVRVFDPQGEDKTPAEGMYTGFIVELGDQVQCLSGVNTAMQTDTKGKVWLNYDSTINVTDAGLLPVKGEIYLDKPGETEVLLKNGTVIKSDGTEFYVKAGTDGESAIVYLFKGSVNVGEFMLYKEKPVARVDASGEIQLYNSKEVPKDIENNLFRARMWRDSIKRFMLPFWARPEVYVPTAVVGAGVAGVIIYKALRSCDTTLHVTVSR